MMAVVESRGVSGSGGIYSGDEVMTVTVCMCKTFFGEGTNERPPPPAHIVTRTRAHTHTRTHADLGVRLTFVFARVDLQHLEHKK